MGRRRKAAELEFLGTGTSTGVPVAGCRCKNCASDDPRDKRLRSSVLIRRGQRNLIIDTGPEFRIQCLRARVMRLHAVLFTHHHVDHLYGFDDVRAYSFFQDRTLPVYASKHSLEVIRSKFDYIWHAVQVGGGLPDVQLHEIDGPFEVLGMECVPVPIMHGRLPILGFRFGSLAYLTDISELPAESVPLLQNLDTLIISCVRYRYHKTHLTLGRAKQIHKQLRPRQTLLTHLTHAFTHARLAAELPAGIAPAYDGLRVAFEV